MEEINSHVEILSKLCRLCAKKIVTTRSYREPKHVLGLKDVVKARFGIDIDNDASNIHPSSLCNKCYLKLYKLKSKNIDDIERSSDIVSEFASHTKSCTVCFSTGKVGRPKHVEIDAQINAFETIKSKAEENGFLAFNQNSESTFRQQNRTERLFGIVQRIGSSMVNTKTVVLNNNGSWFVYAYDKLINTSTSSLSSLPDTLNINTASLIFSSVADAHICPGNDDFQDLINYKINFFPMLPLNIFNPH